MNRIPGTKRVQRRAAWPVLAVVLLGAAGCRHRNVTPLPPEEAAAPAEPASVPDISKRQDYSTRRGATAPERIPVTPAPPGGVSAEDLEYVARHRPIVSEVGLATWYTAPYKGRKAANGEVFDDRALTAAHRTLPMGSLIVVTNVNTGQSAAMRITDRGPFVVGNVLDLTIASAKATGIYRVGTAQVRIDVYRTPKPIDRGGRWCVQIGAFKQEEQALKLKQQLIRRYPESNVIEFPGEASYWVRIRPVGDDREQAENIARRLRPAEGSAFLTRLD